MSNTDYVSVNLKDPRQDVHKERKHHPYLFRYSSAEKLLPENASGLKVLEIGGGTGEFSRRMKKKGIEVHFMDLNENSLKKVKEELDIPVYKADLNNGLPVFDAETFDGVVILEVIEHIVAAELLLEEISRVLKKGGFLILSTPNFAYFQNRLRILLGNLSSDEGYHYRFFTVSSLQKRIEEAGLKVVKQTHSTPFLGMNLIVNKLLKKPRKHIHIPDLFSSFLAQTLMVLAKKK